MSSPFFSYGAGPFQPSTRQYLSDMDLNSGPPGFNTVKMEPESGQHGSSLMNMPYQTPQGGMNGIKREPGLGTASGSGSNMYQNPRTSSSDDHIIACADHDTLLRVQNGAYMRLWNDHQIDRQNIEGMRFLLEHYKGLMGAPSAPPGLSRFPTPAPAATPTHSSSSFGATPTGLFSSSFTAPSQGVSPSLRQLEPVAPLVKAEYPLTKFWERLEWDQHLGSKANRGIAKGKRNSETTERDINSKLKFLIDRNGELITSSLLSQITKAYNACLHEIVTTLKSQKRLDDFPSTWGTAGDQIKSYCVLTIHNKFEILRLCSNMWKAENLCSVKWGDWARTHHPDLTRRSKVINIDDNDDDDEKPAAKRQKVSDPSPKVKVEPGVKPAEPAASPKPGSMDGNKEKDRDEPVDKEKGSTNEDKGKGRAGEKKAPVKETKPKKNLLAGLTIPAIDSTIVAQAVPLVPAPKKPKPAPKSIAVTAKAPATTSTKSGTVEKSESAPKGSAAAQKSTEGSRGKGKKRKAGEMDSEEPTGNTEVAEKEAEASVAVTTATAGPSKVKKGLMPTTAITARNLYLIDYRNLHGPVSQKDFAKAWSSLGMTELLAYERKATAKKAEAQAARPAKQGRPSKKAKAAAAAAAAAPAPIPEDEEEPEAAAAQAVEAQEELQESELSELGDGEEEEGEEEEED